jgi:hypothetical protein
MQNKRIEFLPSGQVYLIFADIGYKGKWEIQAKRDEKR